MYPSHISTSEVLVWSSLLRRPFTMTPIVTPQYASICKVGWVRGLRMSKKGPLADAEVYLAGAGLPNIAPHDLRRTTAKLCRAAGGELGQIQLLLGHSSVQTKEAVSRDEPGPSRLRKDFSRSLLVQAPNDDIKLKLL